MKSLCKISESQKRIRIPTRDGIFQAVSNDAGTSDGFAVSACVADECWAWKGRQLWDVVSQLVCKRPDGILVVISTAGSNQDHFFYDLYMKAKRIIEGTDTDITFFPTVFETPPTADLMDESSWALSNPSLGTSFTKDDLKRTILAAQSSVSELRTVRQKRLNQWVQADDSWIDLSKWDDCKGATPIDGVPCVLGVDLSQTTDPSSVSAVWSLPENRFVVQSWGWVCSDGVKIREKGNLPLFQQFAGQGSMTITTGGTIDERRIKTHILDLCKRYKVQSIVFDPNSAYVLAKDLESEGIECLRQPQTHKYYNPAIKAMERAIHEKRIIHDGNTWLRYCVNNMRLDENAIGEVRPSKRKAADHIDGAVAMLLAFGQAATGGSGQKVVTGSPLLWI
jgi:phage terminase large subunit-like protein